MSSFSQSTSFYWYAPPRDLHSFPTRRSSDLKRYRNSSYGVFNGRLSLDMDLPRGDALQVSLRSEEHTSELQSRGHLVCRLLLEKKKLRTILTCKNMANSGQSSTPHHTTAGTT